MAGHSRSLARRASRLDPPALGQHFLRPHWAARLVADAAVPPGELVLDLGAGTGALTARLLDAGARVIAVELDPRLADGLRRRFADRHAVRVVQADARRVGLPRRPFRVVANLPFASGTAVLRHLLAPGSTLQAAHVLLDWHAALKRSDARRLLGAQWGPWFELAVGRRFPANAFTPPPPVDAGVLTIRRRRTPHLHPAEQAAYERWVADRFRRGLGRDRSVEAWARAWRRR